ncbi:MAG: aminodeoxychorismate/anthranilate synthase component II [Candidatus Kaelpia aquatica]|nr:aminodeoxychorismate/anthranilate synthase component II [Candidatus Kaelpia aquatica]
MIVMIDNYDSFTYNLVQYLGELGANVKVFRNDKVSLDEIKRIKPSHIVISPGPGRPDDAGISKDVILEFYKHVPILGVCLGHQAIAEVFGAKIVRAKCLMHGKTSPIYHNGKDLFKDIPNPFEATRYHSLIVKPSTVSSVFAITAETEGKEIMGIKYKKYPLFGVQFHPESILTSAGHDILNNFLKC